MQTKTNSQARVLVIEDDQEWLDIFLPALQGEGYCIEIARNIRGARAALNKMMPDVVVLDMRLDETSNKVQGWELVKSLKSPPYGPQIIVISGFLSDPAEISILKDRRDFGGYNVFRYLPKTRYNREDFRATVRMAIEEKRELMKNVPVSLKLRNLDDVNGRLTERKLEELTRMEHRVLGRLVTGDSNREIGIYLIIEENTVKTHVANILAKLQLEKRAKILPFALEIGLFE